MVDDEWQTDVRGVLRGAGDLKNETESNVIVVISVVRKIRLNIPHEVE